MGPALVQEGELMLQALLWDLLAIPGVKVVVLRDRRLPIPAGFSGPIQWVAVERDPEALFAELLGSCDAAWPIAPETGGVLERLCRTVALAHKPLLNSPAETVAIAASKLATARCLEAAGVAAVPTELYRPTGAPPPGAWVVKPDDGVGGQGTYVIEPARPARWPDRRAGRHVLQPLIEGEALSLSVLFANGQSRLLGSNRQQVVRDGAGFTLQGLTVNGVAEDAQLRALAAGVGRALPGLWGYAGIDLIRSAAGLWVLEVNPRLTTAYVGLRRSTGLNPAALVLDLWRHGVLPEPGAGRRDPVAIHFTAELPASTAGDARRDEHPECPAAVAGDDGLFHRER
ncbi:Predicted ATP-dependent carboligase, ATP-grasp superfamily [Candidatus Methylocalor cossyra]|uniref:Predicted ATP-dependent carboligase, ATP-grasp superfamily n=2 Tax=Candidatus Methylocalor cossyra TaxID=3108543 RepID=A0ABM9NEH2_9GAMM